MLRDVHARHSDGFSEIQGLANRIALTCQYKRRSGQALE